MRYRLHEGIVYTRISNVYLLVATRKVWDQFSSVYTLSPVEGWLCSGLANGMDTEEIICNEDLRKKLPEPTIRKKLDQIIEKLIKENYLIPEEHSAAD